MRDLKGFYRLRDVAQGIGTYISKLGSVLCLSYPQRIHYNHKDTSEFFHVLLLYCFSFRFPGPKPRGRSSSSVFMIYRSSSIATII